MRCVCKGNNIGPYDSTLLAETRGVKTRNLRFSLIGPSFTHVEWENKFLRLIANWQSITKDAGRKNIGGTQIASLWLKSRVQELSNGICYSYIGMLYTVEKLELFFTMPKGTQLRICLLAPGVLAITKGTDTMSKKSLDEDWGWCGGIVKILKFGNIGWYLKHCFCHGMNSLSTSAASQIEGFRHITPVFKWTDPITVHFDFGLLRIPFYLNCPI